MDYYSIISAYSFLATYDGVNSPCLGTMSQGADSVVEERGSRTGKKVILPLYLNC